MQVIGVIVRPPGQREPEPGGHFDITPGHRVIVIGMVRLERVQAGSRKIWNPLVVSDQDGVRQRREPSRLVNAVEDFLRTRTSPRNERRPSALQPAPKCFIHVRHMTAGDERSGNPRTTGRLQGVVKSRLKNRIGIELNAMLRQSMHHFVHPIDPPAALLAKKRLQCSRAGVDEVAENVDVGAFDNRGDLNPGNEINPRGLACLQGGLTSGGRVMVGDAEDFDPGCGRTGHEVRRRASAVRRGRVGMEIDQRAARLRPEGRRPAV